MKTLNFNCPPFLSSHFFQRYKIPIVSDIFKIWFQSKWKDKVTGSYKRWIVPVERDNCAGMANNNNNNNNNSYYYYNDLNNSNSVQKSSAPNADCKTCEILTVTAPYLCTRNIFLAPFDWPLCCTHTYVCKYFTVHEIYLLGDPCDYYSPVQIFIFNFYMKC